MANLQAIRDEIDTDPLTRGYAGMSDLAVADSMNTVNIASTVDTSPASLLGAIKAPAWPQGGANADTRADEQAARDYVIALCSLDAVPLTEVEVQTKLTGVTNGIFSGATKTSIEALWATTISRAQELKLGKVREGTVAQARAL